MPKDIDDFRGRTLPEREGTGDRLDLAIATLLSLGSFLLYLRTLAPTVLAADSGEFQFASYVLGLVHPTGYPLYLLLAKLFTYLPVGDVAYRVNLMSAFWAALTVGLLYLCSLHLIRRRTPPGLAKSLSVTLPAEASVPAVGESRIRGFSRSDLLPRLSAIVAATAFAVSETFWSQAVIAEVYTLNAFFVALTLLLLVSWRSTPTEQDKATPARYPLMLAFTLGLSLAHHRSMLLLIPAYAVYLWLTRPKLGRKQLSDRIFQRSILPFAVFALPLLLYLYIPLRAPFSTYLSVELAPGQSLSLYSNDLSGFLDMVSGRVFGSKIETGMEATLEGRGRYYLDLAARQFGLAGLGLAIVGATWTLWRRREVFTLLGLMYLATVVFGLVYRIGDVFVFFIPAHMILAIFIGLGLRSLLSLAWPDRVLITGHQPQTRVGAGLMNLNEVFGRCSPGSEASAGKGDTPAEASDPGDTALPEQITEVHKTAPKAPASAPAGDSGPFPLINRRWTLLRGGLAMAMIVFALTLVGSSAFSNYARVDMSQAFGIEQRWEQIVAEASPQGAILISDDRDDMVPLWYMQQVERKGTDLLGLFPGIIASPDYANVVRLIESVRPTNRPVYLVKAIDGLQVKYDVRPKGSLFEVAGEPKMSSASRAVQAGFGAVVRLLDFGWAPPSPLSAKAPAVAAGDKPDIILRWRALAAMKKDYRTFVHVVDSRGQLVAQSDATPGAFAYPTSRWAVGETLSDRHQLQLPAGLPGGFYDLRAGLYDPASMANLTTGQGEGSVVIGRLFVKARGGAPAPQRPVQATFGSSLRLKGYDLEQGAQSSNQALTVKGGKPFGFVLHWAADAEVSTDYTVFVHVVDQLGRVVAQKDDMPQSGKAPTSDWPAGETILDARVVDLPPTLSEGSYAVIVGLYDAKTGQRLPLDTGGDSLKLLELRVTP